MVFKRIIFPLLSLLFVLFVTACNDGNKPTPHVTDDEFNRIFDPGQNEKKPGDTVETRPEVKTEDDNPPAETGEPTIRVFGESDLRNIKVGTSSQVRIKLENFSGDFQWKFAVSGGDPDFKLELKETTSKQYLVATPSKAGAYTIDLKAVALDSAGTIIAAKTMTAQAYLPLTIGNSSLGEMLFGGSTVSIRLTITGGSGQYACESGEAVNGGVTVGFQKEDTTCKVTLSHTTKPGLLPVRLLVGDTVLGEKVEKTLSVTVKEDFAVNVFTVNGCGMRKSLDPTRPGEIYSNEAIAIIVQGHDTGYNCSWDRSQYSPTAGLYHTNEYQDGMDPSVVALQGGEKLACLFTVPTEVWYDYYDETISYELRDAFITVQNGSGGSSETVSLPELSFKSWAASDYRVRAVMTGARSDWQVRIGQELSSSTFNVRDNSISAMSFDIQGGLPPYTVECLQGNGQPDRYCKVHYFSDTNPPSFNLAIQADFDDPFNQYAGSDEDHHLYVKDSCAASPDSDITITLRPAP